MANCKFPRTERALAAALKEAELDHEAFAIPVVQCVLGDCRATCCHDGVILSEEESSALKSLDPIDGITVDSSGKFRTRVRAANSSELAEDFPSHFPRTRCIYLDGQHRCYWQLLAVNESRDPWYYKPISCWMHPILLAEKQGRPFLTLLSNKEDQERFASQTPCGRCKAGAPPAKESLKSELEMLGRISGRNFYRELSAPPGFLPHDLANDSSSG